MPNLDLENIYCWQRSTGFISKRYNLIGYLLSIYSVMDNGKVSFLTVCTGGEFEPCLGGVGWGIWTWTVKSSSRIHVLYLLIWRCSKLKSSHLQADGSEEKSYKKVMVTDLALCKKLTFKSSSWVGHLNAILVHGGRNWNEPIFKSLNVLVVVTYFSYYRRNARGNHCNNKKLTLKRLFPFSVLVPMIVVGKYNQ